MVQALGLVLPSTFLIMNFRGYKARKIQRRFSLKLLTQTIWQPTQRWRNEFSGEHVSMMHSLTTCLSCPLYYDSFPDFHAHCSPPALPRFLPSLPRQRWTVSVRACWTLVNIYCSQNMDQPSKYELQILKNIQENKKVLATLGLDKFKVSAVMVVTGCRGLKFTRSSE